MGLSLVVDGAAPTPVDVERKADGQQVGAGVPPRGNVVLTLVVVGSVHVCGAIVECNEPLANGWRRATSIRSVSSPVTRLSLEVDGVSSMLVNVECGAGGSKVGTEVQEAVSSWQVVTCVVGGNMSGEATSLVVVSAERSSNTPSL